jgi:hypothetical protein
MGWRVHILFLVCWAATAIADVANVATLESATALARPLVGPQSGFSPVADVCTGTSAGLPTAECQGWIKFFDATTGTTRACMPPVPPVTEYTLLPLSCNFLTPTSRVAAGAQWKVCSGQRLTPCECSVVTCVDRFATGKHITQM